MAVPKCKVSSARRDIAAQNSGVRYKVLLTRSAVGP